jgi:hypothetical protein
MNEVIIVCFVGRYRSHTTVSLKGCGLLDINEYVKSCKPKVKAYIHMRDSVMTSIGYEVAWLNLTCLSMRFVAPGCGHGGEVHY